METPDDPMPAPDGDPAEPTEPREETREEMRARRGRPRKAKPNPRTPREKQRGIDQGKRKGIPFGARTRAPVKLRQGRETALSHDLIRKFADLVAGGAPALHVARAMFIPDATYYCWRRRGEMETEGLWFDFVEALTAAESQAIVNNCRNVQRAANQPKTWAAAAKMLSWLDPIRFADKREHVHSGTVEQRSVNVNVNLSGRVPDHEAALLAGILFAPPRDGETLPAPVKVIDVTPETMPAG